MKCFYTYDENGEKFFIPMCYSTMYTFDKRDCTCSNPLTEHQFAKERFNKIIKEKNETIKCMESELKNLRKVIEKLKHSSKK